MTNQKNIKLIIFLFFLYGAWIRTIDLWRPVDGRVRELWRECDYAAVAKNYYEEDMNLFYPRIDWRGDGPGYAEMEFPIFPWSVAILYKVFGYNEIYGRIFSYIFSLLTLLIFFRLAYKLLPPFGALMSSLFFTICPLCIRISNSLQPEGVMLFFLILAVYAFINWLNNESWSWYFIAIFGTAVAVLVKINAVHIGFLFLSLLIWKKGFKSLRNIRILFFPALALLPAFLWYIHAHRLWLVYGNSLGVSNEYHWVGWDIFTNPIFLYRLARIELLYVWMPLGGIIAIFSLKFIKSNETTKISFLWLIAIIIFYIVTIRTTSDNWAIYYHIVSVPPAALLFGVVSNFLSKKLRRDYLLGVAIIVSIVISLSFILSKLLLNINFPRRMHLFLILLSAVVTVVLFIPNIIREKYFSHREQGGKANFIGSCFLLFCVLSILNSQSYQVSRDLHPKHANVLYDCAQTFKPLILKNQLIIVSGQQSTDEFGYPIANNPPYMFFWLDSKGFNIALEDHTMDVINSLILRGARYFVLEKRTLHTNPSFLAELKREYTLIYECQTAYLFELLKDENGDSIY